MIEQILLLFALTQMALGFRVVARWFAGKGAVRLIENRNPTHQRVSIIIPTLNEATRIEACLASCARQTEEVVEILVVDGGSTDETRDIVNRCRRFEPRIRLLPANPVPNNWTGKAWGLNVGVNRASPESDWVLCLDADVRTGPNLTRSLVAHAAHNELSAFSVATCQRLADVIDAVLHPAMLTTLIYRFGLPGRAVKQSSQIQANGQCFICRRDLLLRTHALTAAHASLCEDITLARHLARAEVPVGFYEAEAGLLYATMYSAWRETWYNWPRSLPMRDQYFGWREWVGLGEIVMLQALALPLLTLTLSFGLPNWLIAATGVWVLVRAGVLAGARRAYPNKPWSYWLSPLADLPVVTKIICSALRRHHSWRGRHYLRVQGGTFRVVDPRP